MSQGHPKQSCIMMIYIFFIYILLLVRATSGVSPLTISTSKFTVKHGTSMHLLFAFLKHEKAQDCVSYFWGFV